MTDFRRTRKDDPFLLNYNPDELRIASEFLSTWLPFLSRGLCRRCTQTLSGRIRSLEHDRSCDEESLKPEDNMPVSASDLNECAEDHDNCDANSLGSWKDGVDMNDNEDTNSLGSWKDGADGLSEPVAEASITPPAAVGSPRVKMSWADMAQEDELEAEEDNDVVRQTGNGNALSGEGRGAKEAKPKKELSRDQREYIRFCSVKRKKDFICLERVNGKIVNILDGLELHTGVFSAAEQKRIVKFVEQLQEMGKNGQLKERTYTAPEKWMRGKGRVTIQFGCCYNYAKDKNGNPPGILRDEMVDPIPQLLKVMIKRLVRWHVMPPSCVPDSCIVNIYEEGDCIPPHIDHHDFLRPFCTVSFLSECNVVFGANLKVMGAGEFGGSVAIPLPVGSVLVLNGNGADVAKHCVPAVPTKRISITFRKMDESKQPIGFVPELDLQGLEPLAYESDRIRKHNFSRSRPSFRRQLNRREDNNTEKYSGSTQRNSEPRYPGRSRQGPINRQRTNVTGEN